MWGLGSFLVKYISDKPNIMRMFLGLNFPVKKRITIIGGQFAGCELALSLMEKGKIVTIIEESKRLGSDIGPVTRWIVIQKLRAGGVRLETLAKVKEITNKGVKVSREEDKEEFFEADTIMLALGLKGNTALANELEGKVPAVYLIGDAVEGSAIKRIREAIASGFEIGSSI